jgi:hypothetical protein
VPVAPDRTDIDERGLAEGQRPRFGRQREREVGLDAPMLGVLGRSVHGRSKPGWIGQGGADRIGRRAERQRRVDPGGAGREFLVFAPSRSVP